MEIQILNWLQSLHTPILDKIMQLITHLGDMGIIWIILTIVMLLIPKTRKSGVIMAAALIVDVILCNVILKNLIARVRPYDVNTAVQVLVAKPKDFSFPSGHTAASFASVTALYLAGEKKTVETSPCAGNSNRIFQNVPVCTLSDRHSRWSYLWKFKCMDWIPNIDESLVVCYDEKRMILVEMRDFRWERHLKLNQTIYQHGASGTCGFWKDNAFRRDPLSDRTDPQAWACRSWGCVP